MRNPLIRNLFIASALSSLLLATSCASEQDSAPLHDLEANHPITVDPTMAALNLPANSAEAGLLPPDEARLKDFVAAYLAHGSGAISVVAPQGPGSEQALHYFGARLTALGVPAQKILVGTDTAAGTGISLRFIDYQAHVAPCTGWSDFTDTWDNAPLQNMGCATQHNTAAMVADPRDLIAPRGMDDVDANRRATVVGKYEQGQPTAATKSADQTVTVSNTGSGS